MNTKFEQFEGVDVSQQVVAGMNYDFTVNTGGKHVNCLSRSKLEFTNPYLTLNKVLKLLQWNHNLTFE